MRTEHALTRRTLLASAGAVPLLALASDSKALSSWVRLPAEEYRGKQDDVFFVDEFTGWYGNGLGKLFHTTDGGQTWAQLLDRPGTFIRALGFLNAEVGFLGNIGPGYFPNVSDDIPLYRTADGGVTWAPVEIAGIPMAGVCAIDILRQCDGSACVEEPRITVRAAGRVGGPAQIATSRDGGRTWACEDLSDITGMVLDVHFIDEQVGFLCGATNSNVADSRALILRTVDGGASWSPVFEGHRPWEITWKMSWPSKKVGYVTIQGYDPDPAASQRYVAKTTDGGLNWAELPLIDDRQVRAFGIGFVDEHRGWVGAVPNGFETLNGGVTWVPTAMGAAVNKIRIIPKAGGGTVAFAIGAELHRIEVPGR